MKHKGLIGTALGMLVAAAGWSIAGASQDFRDAPGGRASAGGTVAFQVPVTEDIVHLYIIEDRWFGVYELNLRLNKCELKVARDFSGDVQLNQVGSEHVPPVVAVKQAVSGHGRRREAGRHGVPKPSPD